MCLTHMLKILKDLDEDFVQDNHGFRRKLLKIILKVGFVQGKKKLQMRSFSKHLGKI